MSHARVLVVFPQCPTLSELDKAMAPYRDGGGDRYMDRGQWDYFTILWHEAVCDLLKAPIGCWGVLVGDKFTLVGADWSKPAPSPEAVDRAIREAIGNSGHVVMLDVHL